MPQPRLAVLRQHRPCAQSYQALDQSKGEGRRGRTGEETAREGGEKVADYVEKSPGHERPGADPAEPWPPEGGRHVSGRRIRQGCSPSGSGGSLPRGGTAHGPNDYGFAPGLGCPKGLEERGISDRGQGPGRAVGLPGEMLQSYTRRRNRRLHYAGQGDLRPYQYLSKPGKY